GLLGGGILAPAAAPGGLSFIGVSFNEGERISKCQITSGTVGLAGGHFNGRNGADVVAMDDFIYGEPQPVLAPPSILTATAFPINNSVLGDSRSDFAVFRLGVVSWFVLQSSPKPRHERAHIKRVLCRGL
ncbi:MAG: hypothetical protein LC770_02720, partial [Acidobacteria bacterium]|nr:hypothetical protein [Acidobacteriota bacterium]